MRKHAKTTMILLGVMSLLAFTSGCGYLQDRGNDALDVFDMGFLIPSSPKPQLGLYLDFFSSAPLFYADIECKKIGSTNREIGIFRPLDFKYKKWGYLAKGSEWEEHPKFNPNDPHLARNDQRDLTEPARYTAGVMGLINEKENRPPWTQYIECDRMLYLGWIGYHMHCRPLDVVDFILGWTTIDIMGDDDIKPLDEADG